MSDAATPCRSVDAASILRPHVSIRDVSKRFGQFVALKGVSLDIQAGELVCFLGPSGCGKTTLLRAIAGLDPQDEGRVEIGGRDVTGLPPAERDFGIVFQSYALFPNLTVAANVGYGLASRRRSRKEIDARVTELLAMVGLADQSRKYPVQLSGGQQQRVALARALATSPSLLLLDEPLSALDARVRVRLRDELKSLQRRLGLTTIMVTHDQEEAMGLADRMVVMNQGVIEQVGTPTEIYAEPVSRFVADFVGTMNLLAARSRGSNTVSIGNFEVSTAHPIEAAAGSTLHIAVRPEDVQVSSRSNCSGSGRQANTIIAHVVSRSFHGGFWRVGLRPVGLPETVLFADMPANRLEGIELDVEAAVHAVLPAERLRVFER